MTRAEQIKQAIQMRDEYVKAELAVLKSQSYNIGGQSLTRADLATICRERNRWQQILNALTGGAIKMRRIIPVD